MIHPEFDRPRQKKPLSGRSVKEAELSITRELDLSATLDSEAHVLSEARALIRQFSTLPPQEEKKSDPAYGYRDKHTPPEPQRICIRYNGTLSDRLIWELTDLANVESSIGLRRRVVIRNGNERPGAEATQMGDILAWKAFGNPLEMFSKRRAQRAQESYVDSEKPYGSVDIVINDQVLSERIRRENNNFFDEKKFVAELNTYISQGLRAIAIQEQFMLATVTTVYCSFPLLAALPMGITYLAASDMIRLAPHVFTDDVSHLVFSLEGITVFSMSSMAGVLSAFTWRFFKEILKEKSSVFQSWGDLSPLKYLTQALRTTVYFAFTEKKAVTLADKK